MMVNRNRARKSWPKIVLVMLGLSLLLWVASEIIRGTCSNYSPRSELHVKEISAGLMDRVAGYGRNGYIGRKNCSLYPNSSDENLVVSRPLGTILASFIKIGSTIKKHYSQGDFFLPGDIPKILHTTWKTDAFTEAWKMYSETCRDADRDFVFCHWTDSDLDIFVASEYPDLLKRFLSYPYPIQRADAGRYMLLHRFGGVYRDVNVGCAMPFDHILFLENHRQKKIADHHKLHPADFNFKVLLVGTEPFGVAGDLMMSSPRHPFFDQVLTSLPNRPYRYGLPFLDVMLTTGPMFLSGVLSSFRTNSSISDTVKGEVGIIPADHRGDGPRYFYYRPGGTWHCIDGILIWWIFVKKSFLIAFIIILIVIAFIVKKFSLKKHRIFKGVVL